MKSFIRSSRCRMLLAAALATIFAFGTTGCDNATAPDTVEVVRTSTYSHEFTTMNGETPMVTIGYRTFPVRLLELSGNFAITTSRTSGSISVMLRSLQVYMDGDTTTLAAMVFASSSDMQWSSRVSDELVRRLRVGAKRNSLAEQMNVVKTYLDGLDGSAFPDVPVTSYTYLVPTTIILTPDEWGANVGSLMDWMAYPYRSS